MTNKIEVDVSANETISDAMGNAADSTQKAEKVIVKSMGTTEAAFDTAARESGKFGKALDSAQGFTGQLADGADGVTSAIGAVQDVMSHASRKASELAHAQQDVDQANQDLKQSTEDLAQAQRDGHQATIDLQQASVDLAQAQLDSKQKHDAYLEAVKKFGANSAEAQQALIDYKQTAVDVQQANEDAAQAQRDLSQANLDGKQAMIDQKGAATDLKDANNELISQNSSLGKISDWASMFSGILGGLTGIIGVVTAVQWAWNVAMSANPIGIIVVAVGALIAVIIYLATKTKFFQTIWHAIWSKIGDPVKATWNWIKKTTSSFINWIVNVFKAIPKAVGSAFKSLANIITAPYKLAFNGIAWAWNHTIGGLHFSIPNWVPGIGGASFSVPNIPYLAKGTDEVLKSGLAMIHKGEKIVPAAKAKDGGYSGHPDFRPISAEELVVRLAIQFEGAITDSKIMKIIIDNIRTYVNVQGGGNVQVALGRSKGK